MKVKVIDVNGASNLAIGKVYDVVEQKANGNFVITNEVGVNVSFKASRFEVVADVVVTPIKVGDVLKDTEDNHYLVIFEGCLVALVDMKNGEIIKGFHAVEDMDNITKEELEIMDGDDLVKA